MKTQFHLHASPESFISLCVKGHHPDIFSYWFLVNISLHFFTVLTNKIAFLKLYFSCVLLYKWNFTICILLWWSSFHQHYICKVHSCFYMVPFFFTCFSLLHIISLYDYLPFLILAVIELLPFLSYYEFHSHAHSNSYIFGTQGNSFLLGMLKSGISESK